MELINTERSTIKKIDENIDRINEMIDQTEKKLGKNLWNAQFSQKMSIKA